MGWLTSARIGRGRLEEGNRQAAEAPSGQRMIDSDRGCGRWAEVWVVVTQLLALGIKEWWSEMAGAMVGVSQLEPSRKKKKADGRREGALEGNKRPWRECEPGWV